MLQFFLAFPIIINLFPLNLIFLRNISLLQNIKHNNPETKKILFTALLSCLIYLPLKHHIIAISLPHSYKLPSPFPMFSKELLQKFISS